MALLAVQGIYENGQVALREQPEGVARARVVVMFLPEDLQADLAESRGWPPGFFEQTFGSLRDDPLERLPQGEQGPREALE